MPPDALTATVAAVMGALTLGSAGSAFAVDKPATKADIKADTAKVKRDRAKLKAAKTPAAKAKARQALRRADADLRLDRKGG